MMGDDTPRDARSLAAASRSREVERTLLLEVAEWHDEQAKTCLASAEGAERDGHDNLARHQYAACGVYEASAAYIRSRLPPASSVIATGASHQAHIRMALKDIRTEARTAQQDLLQADDEEVNGHLNIIMRIVDRALAEPSSVIATEEEDVKGLVERLKDERYTHYIALRLEAAQALTSLASENSQLREALKPFAEQANRMDASDLRMGESKREDSWEYWVKTGDLRLARSVHSKLKGE